MAKRTRRNASRGSVNNIILETLYSGSKYGYEIIKEVENKTDGKIVLKQPSLYSSLTRFENKGYVTSSWADSEIGGRRHYYTLTDAGRKYYESNVLNKRSSYEFLNDDYEFNNNVEEVDNVDDNEEYNIDSSETDDNDNISSYSYSNYNFDVNDRINSLLADEDDAYTTDDEIEEPQEDIMDDIPDYEPEEYEENDIEEPDVKDDSLYIEEEQTDSDNEYTSIEELDNIEDNEIDKYIQETTNNDTIKYTNNLSREINNVYNSIKASTIENNRIVQDETLYEREQKKQNSMNILYGNHSPNEYSNRQTQYTFNEAQPTYFVDENGITKKYINTNAIQQTNNRTINSVEQSNMFNSSDFDEIMRKGSKTKTTTKAETHNNIDQFDTMTEEEIAERNKKFLEKFDNIADSRMVKPQLAEEENSEYSNEQSFVDSQYANFEEDEDDSYYFKYDRQEDEDESVLEEDNDNNIKISEYNAHVRYKNDISDIDINQRSYIKSNKAKFFLGISLLIVMLVELTSLLIILKGNTLFTTTDNTIFIFAYVLVIAISLILILPIFFNPNKRKLNTFKFGYSLILGVLSFLVLCTLTYAINSFLGLDATNIEYFYTKLIVPCVLAFNLVLGPIIYKIITMNKKLY
ncbi:MAG: hypothetical protein E7361_00785 [Clostridiales bacterium]|nr:hypothetical protein [Clostridiales bacterium]